jgi:hypothetical protein
VGAEHAEHAERLRVMALWRIGVYIYDIYN